MIKLRTKAKTPWDSKRMRVIDATKNERGITLVALIVTIIFSYDEKLKCSNSKGFLLQTI